MVYKEKNVSCRTSRALYHELVKRRELVHCMVKGKEKAAVYKSILGNLWFLITPCLQIAMYYLLVVVIFGASGARPAETFLALCMGILHYALLGNTSSQTQSSIYGNSSLLLQVHLEPFVLIWVGFLRALRQWLHAVAIFFVLYLFLGPTPTMNLLAYPLVAILWIAFCWTAGLWFAQITVFIRDLEKFLPTCLQMLMYSAPVIYPMSFYPNNWTAWMLVCNPVASAFSLFRWSLLGQACPVILCTVSLSIWTAFSFILAHRLYAMTSRGFTKAF